MAKSDDDKARHDMVVQDGKPLPMAPADVRRTVLRMVDEGDILAVIVRMDDAFAVQVFGPPSMEMVEALEEVTRSFRTAVENAS